MRKVTISVEHDGRLVRIMAQDDEKEPALISITNVDQCRVIDHRTGIAVLSGEQFFNAPRTRHPT